MKFVTLNVKFTSCSIVLDLATITLLEWERYAPGAHIQLPIANGKDMKTVSFERFLCTL